MDKIPSSKSSATRVVAIQALFLGVVCDSPLIARDSHNIPDLGGLPYEKDGDARSGGRVFPIMAYTGRLFHASGVWKGRDFAS